MRTPESPKTLYDKIFDEHVVRMEEDGTATLYIDRHLVHEVTSAQAFEGLRMNNCPLWRKSSIVATADHNTPTTVGKPEWRALPIRSPSCRSRHWMKTFVKTDVRRFSRSCPADRASSTLWDRKRVQRFLA